MYHCPVEKCNYQVVTQVSLQIHIKNIHSLDHEFKCEVCVASFAAKAELKKHVTKYHYNEEIGKRVVDRITVFYCMKGCSYSTQSLKNGRLMVRRHYSYHGANHKHECPHCDISYKCETNIKCHIKTCHPEIHADSAGGRSLSRHLATSSRTDSSERFTTKRRRMLECGKGCDFSTPNKTDLERHYRSHGTSLKYKCGLCDFSHDQKQYYLNHLKKHHHRKSNQSLENRKLQTKKLENSTLQMKIKNIREMELNDRVDELSRHLKYNCKKGCDFNSYRNKKNKNKKQDLVIHHQYHGADSEFKCDLCNLSRTQQSRLDYHRKMHHGERSTANRNYTNRSNQTKTQHKQNHHNNELSELENSEISKIRELPIIESIKVEDQSSSRESSCPGSVEDIFDESINTIDLDGIDENMNDKTSTQILTNNEYHYCDICNTPFSTKQFLDQHKQYKHNPDDTSHNSDVDLNFDPTTENPIIKYQNVKTHKILKISRIRTSKTKDREYESKIKIELEHNAAIKIQTAWKRFNQRKRTNFIMKLQCMIRKFLAIKRFKELQNEIELEKRLKAVIILQKHVKILVEKRIMLAQLNKAAIAIQRRWRSYSAFKKLEQLEIEKRWEDQQRFIKSKIIGMSSSLCRK